MLGEGACERAGEGEQAAFGGAVGYEIGQALDAADGAHVDDAAAAGFAHRGDGVFAAVEGAAQVDVEDLFPEVGGGLLAGGAGEPAGVVDQAVELFVGADGFVDQGSALGFIAEVDRVEAGAAAFSADCGGGLLASFALDVGHDYGCAFCGTLAGAAEADALGGAGHQDDFVLEAIGHGSGTARI